jgi:beta-glucanase (GH16 family)
MKITKKIASVVLVAAMVVTTVATAPTVTTQAKLKIVVGKKLALSVGESDFVMVKEKGATYTSSNKKIATVSKKGEVTGKGVGTCKIVIKKGSDKATAKVTVKPGKVKLKSVTNVGSVSATSAAQKATIKATWKKVKGASGYYVYYATSKNGKYTKKTVKGGKKTSLKISGLAYGPTYFVKVKAFGGKKKLTSDEYSKVLSVKTWTLNWSDEFNGNKLDTSVWTYEIGNKDGWGNQESEYYTAGDNIKFENGSLVIIPRMKTVGGETEYTSTRIKTADKKTFKYGKMEIRAKASKGTGTWSAGWMLGDGTGDSRGWPYDGEIDIMESMNGKVPQTIHCEYYNNQSWSHGNKNYSTGLSQAQSAQAYHTYGIIWTDKYIQFTVDGVNKGKYDPSRYTAKNYEMAWKGAFDHPFFFILNCAIGGNAAGKVSKEGWTKINDNLYEDYFYIDYVRVYK